MIWIKAAEYKINIQKKKKKTNLFLYISNEHPQDEMKNSIYNSIQKNKIFRNKFNNRCVRLTLWRLLLKEIKDLNKWKDIPMFMDQKT